MDFVNVWGLEVHRFFVIVLPSLAASQTPMFAKFVPVCPVLSL